MGRGEIAGRRNFRRVILREGPRCSVLRAARYADGRFDFFILLHPRDCGAFRWFNFNKMWVDEEMKGVA